MCMNSKDERLYHYEYRKPRHYNPTYNSNNLFDSLNMFVRNDLPSHMSRSYGTHSLPRQDNPLGNSSDIVDYRQSRYNNNSSIGNNPSERPRPSVYLTDKDQQYMRMMEEKQSLNNPDLSYSRHFNPEQIPETTKHVTFDQSPKQHQPLRQLDYRLNDSLSRQINDYSTTKR